MKYQTLETIAVYKQLMNLSDFDYSLPPELIADRPVSPRDAARMLVVEENKISDNIIRNLPDFLNPGDVLVFNDTRVIPARLIAKRGKATIEINLNRKLEPCTWSAFGRPLKRVKAGDILEFGEGLIAEVISKQDMELVLMFGFNVIPAQAGIHLDSGLRRSDTQIMQAIHRLGKMPLPPYMAHAKQPDAKDESDYQTVYAKREGAVAAPTAGLHFTEEILEKIRAKGLQTAFVTLHVGGGTFLPVKCDDITQHKMHSEWYEVSPEAADTINQTRANGGRVIAVGTTSLRTLESSCDENGLIKPASGDTDIFIYPGYSFKAVDALLTNFHLPKSTLLMLVSAFAGYDNIRNAYAHAIAEKYRFFSYGDCCLLKR